MKSLDKRVRILEDAMLELANDVKWIKKMGYFVVSSPIITEILHKLWK